MFVVKGKANHRERLKNKNLIKIFFPKRVPNKGKEFKLLVIYYKI